MIDSSQTCHSFGLRKDGRMDLLRQCAKLVSKSTKKRGQDGSSYTFDYFAPHPNQWAIIRTREGHYS